jgi:hypothetical protein
MDTVIRPSVLQYRARMTFAPGAEPPVHTVDV